MDVIITGASGFVGRNLTKYLIEKSNSVTTISLRQEGWQSTFPKVGSAVIHLAGKAHDTSNTSSDVEYFKINRDLTINLFNEFLKSDIKDFFYFSSVKAVADSVTGILKEDVVGNPKTPYGRSKFEAEEYLLKQSLPNSKRLFIIRPCMIHGPGNKGNLNLLYNVVKRGFPWPLGSFNNKRSFLSIGNLCGLINEMLKNSVVKSGIYNFADDESISTNQLIYLISSSLNKKSILWRINQNLILKLAKMGDTLSLPLNSERLKKLTESYVVSNKKIKEALNLTHLPFSVEEGLRATIKSFNSQKS